MITNEITEKQRLYPVISTILKFTPNEINNVNKSINFLKASHNDNSWFGFADISSNSFFG